MAQETQQVESPASLFKHKAEIVKGQFADAHTQLNNILQFLSHPIGEVHKEFVTEAYFLFCAFTKAPYSDDKYCGLHELNLALANYLANSVPDKTLLAKATKWQEFIVFEAWFKKIYRWL
ncbi:MAG: hypothetical protein WCT08_06535 [Patescibacteria group bacterium]|jgi:hypothetical protein